MDRRVDKSEFDAFIAAFPRPLTTDVAGMFEPPILSYNDLSSGKKWPESVVAYVVLHSKASDKTPDEYFIKP